MNQRNLQQLLAERIRLLTIQQTNDMAAMKDQANQMIDELNPFSQIKSIFLTENNLIDSSKKDVIKYIIAISSGFIAKKIFMGKSHSPIKSLLGSFLEVKLANYLSSKFEEIKG